MENKLEKVESKELAQPATLTMLQSAIQSGIEPEKLLQFYELHERWEANEARKAYVKAMSDFNKEPFTITKDALVRYENSDGSYTQYNHASLFNAVNTISEKLANYGLSHRWETSQGEGGRITVTCIITHELGHSEQTSLSNSPDASGGKNNIQAVGSTVTYLQRYTLLALSGKATKAQDNDGSSSDVEMISLEQAEKLTKQITDTKANKEKFLSLFGITDLAQLPASEWNKAVVVLKAKK